MASPKTINRPRSPWPRPDELTPYDETKAWSEDEVLAWLAKHSEMLSNWRRHSQVTQILEWALRHRHDRVFEWIRDHEVISGADLYKRVFVAGRWDLAQKLPDDLSLMYFSTDPKTLAWVIMHKSDAGLADQTGTEADGVGEADEAKVDVGQILLWAGQLAALRRFLATHRISLMRMSDWRLLETQILWPRLSTEQEEWIPAGADRRIRARKIGVQTSLEQVVSADLTGYVLRAA